MKKWLITSVLPVIFIGCENQAVNPPPQQDYLYKVCKKPRPQICTREYIPYVGLLPQRQRRTATLARPVQI